MSRVLEYEMESELESELEMEGEYEAEAEWEMESEYELEAEGEYEWEGEWEGGRPPARPGPRPGGPRRPTTLPTITIRVRPFVVLRGFPHDRATLTPANQRLIGLAARRIVASWRSPGGRRRSVRLVGNADSSGPAAYNLSLGRRRAMAVRLSLMRAVESLQRGLSRRIRFIPQTLGETQPDSPNTTPVRRNRRVQIFPSDV